MVFSESQASLTAFWWPLVTKADHYFFGWSERNGDWRAGFFHSSKPDHGWITASATGEFQRAKRNVLIISLSEEESAHMVIPANLSWFQIKLVGSGFLKMLSRFFNLVMVSSFSFPLTQFLHTSQTDLSHSQDTLRCMLSAGTEVTSSSRWKTKLRRRLLLCYSNVSVWSF